MLDFCRQLGSYINQGFVIFVSCADAAQLAENLCNEQKVKFNEVLKCSNCRPPMESGAFSFAFNRTKIAQKEYIIVLERWLWSWMLAYQL